MWSRSGSTGTARSTQRLGAAEQGPDPRLPRQQRGGAEDEPGQGEAQIAAAQHAELGLLELGAVEGEVGDQQRDGEPDAGDRAAAGDRRPADRRAEPAAAQPRHQPGDAGDADRLAEQVADEDAERDRRAEGGREKSPSIAIPMLASAKSGTMK